MTSKSKLWGLFEVYQSFQTDEEYDNANLLSYSIIKQVPENPKILLEKPKQKKKEWLAFGSLVDTLITEESKLWDKFVLSTEIPTELMKKVAEHMVENNISLPDASDDDIDAIYEACDSKVKWTAATKRSKIQEVQHYIDFIKENQDKYVISTELYNEAVNYVNILTTHPFTKDYFLDHQEQYEKNIEILYQFKIRYNYKGLQCKSKIDMILIDHNQKAIFPIDIKTGSVTPQKFVSESFFDYRYGYQGILYTEGLTQFILTNILEEFKDYSIENFRFIYLNRRDPVYPIVAIMDDPDNMIYDVPPLHEVMSDIQYYIMLIETGNTELIPEHINENKGEINLSSVI